MDHPENIILTSLVSNTKCKICHTVFMCFRVGGGGDKKGTGGGNRIYEIPKYGKRMLKKIATNVICGNTMWNKRINHCVHMNTQLLLG